MIKYPPFFHPITLFFHTNPPFFPCFFSHRMMQNKCFSTTMKQSECASDKAVFYPQKKWHILLSDKFHPVWASQKTPTSTKNECVTAVCSFLSCILKKNWKSKSVARQFLPKIAKNNLETPKKIQTGSEFWDYYC